MPRKVEISHRTIIFTVFFLIGLWLLYQIQQIILAFFVAVILMSALNPLVDKMERKYFPRILAILLLYVLILGVFGLMVASVVPPLVEQTSILINRIPIYIQQFEVPGIDPNLFVSQIPKLAEIPANILKFSLGFFSNLVAVLAILIITFYLLLERKNLKHHLLILFGEDQEKKAEAFINKAEKQLGSWVRGEIILMTIIGVMTYIGLRFLGIEFALPLALLAGILEIVPNIGPVLAAIPAIIAGLAISSPIGLAVAAWYFLVQQLENSLIVPKVMEKAVGVNPLVTILSLAIGFKLGGAVGAIFAVPIILLIQVVASEVFVSKRFQNL
jgi:predicted PurR-regulated permease PerM